MSEERGSAEESRSVKSAERAVRVLELLAAAPGRLTLPELQAKVGYPRSSLHALVRTLVSLGWIEVDESKTRFTVGTEALVTGTAYLDRDPALTHAARTLEALREEVGYTVHFGRRVGTSVIYLASRESVANVHEMYKVGRKMPCHATALGRALLAELTASEVDAILPAELTALTPKTLTDRASVHAELEQVRQGGWAEEVEQVALGVACVACVVDYRIPATDAVSCSVPADMAQDPSKLEFVADAVVRHSRRLGVTLRREGIR